MRSNRRLRRDDEAQVESELPSESPAPVPEIASVLALQRHAGNRAVARLMYSPKNTRLVVPQSFGSRRVPWEDKKLRKGGAQPTDKTLAELANQDTVFREHLMRGMHVTSLSGVGVVPDAELQANAAKLDEARGRHGHRAGHPGQAGHHGRALGGRDRPRPAAGPLTPTRSTARPRSWTSSW